MFRMSRRLKRAVSLAMYIGMAGHFAHAAEAPMAIVEDISAPSSKLQVFDYLQRGTRIDLGPNERLTIGYFESCLIETVIGATVVIGREKSQVSGGGKVKRRFLQCGGPKMVLSGREAAKSAVVVTRDGPAGPNAPVVEIHSVLPFFSFGSPTETFVVERLDRRRAERYEFNVGAAQFDFERSGKTLSRGGVYRATAGERSIVFKVSDIARRETRNALTRLIGF